MSRLEQSLKSVRRKIKAFLYRQRWKEALIFFSFLLLSFGFWYLQSLQQEYEIEISIPVRYKNVPPDITFTDTVPHKIIARVRDKGSVLLNYTFGRTFTPIEANMKSMPKDKGVVTIERKNIESDIYKQLLTTTTLIGFDPAHIHLNYSKQAEKEIPVRFDGNISPAAGFQQSGDLLISPSVVQAYAADVVLDTLKEVKTVFTHISKADKTMTRIISLQKTEGIVYNPESVSITIPIEEFTDKTLDIPVIVSNIPDDYTVRLFPATVKVTCSVPLSRFKDLSEEQFFIQIPYIELEQNITGVMPIELTEKPDWVQSTTITPNKIEFILEQFRSND
ncbi:YbbR-like domain-containing protein [Parabacteroides sp. 52]|uniref:YbbR-like domain-containing protein n=1 Tax=unclassified Parabacteroides TaxID=2649774 RepID=UPI0013D61223|nr:MULTISPECIES: YbbR-like domain-containing protein [unclassified Parabacteroides]MDH6534510.1 hypothetical protein [Parabacteroides sp. PM5-20]NDV55039.1 YbbR-like domain-containing protein [Parabacteroides sp. 52]